ncbi:MAG TPA: type II secretion system protein [Pseudoxanthomonas sp.]|nr:type II secretion system protein [Pseudoxanthomonas sp.]
MSRPAQHGLTLLEMLVVLIIAGMALALGFQSLGQWRRAEAAISAIGAQTRQASLTRDWVQSSLRALMPIADAPFRGEATGLSGVTLQPLLGTQGGATAVEWKVERSGGDLRLVLEEGGQRLELPLEGAESAEFAYMDAEGRMHPQWPPALGQHDHLPAAVVLQVDGRDGPEVWAAAIAGSRNPVPMLYEAEPD